MDSAVHHCQHDVHINCGRGDCKGHSLRGPSASICKFSNQRSPATAADRYHQSIVSVFYVALHNTTTRLNISARNLTQCERVDTLRSLAAFTLRIMATMWLIAAAISITITASRRALCELSVSSKLSDNLPLDNGTTCILNRVALLCSFVAL